MAAKPVLSAEETLQCAVCLSEFTDPRMLPCLHTLCRHCIESLVSALGENFSCPSCRRECSVPTDGVSGFPKNFFLNELKELLSELKKQKATGVRDSKRRECDNAKHDNEAHGIVTTFCAECAEFYCESCKAFHKKVGATRGHELRPVDSVDPSTAISAETTRGSVMCEEHPETKVQFYCDTCHISICTACCLGLHRRHQYRERRMVGKENQKKLEELTKAAQVSVTKIHEEIKNLELSCQNIQRDTSKARQEVKRAANEMRDFVTKREQLLLQQVQDIQEKALAAFQSANDDAKLRRAALESLSSSVQTLRNSGDVTDQVVRAPVLERQLRELQVAPPAAVTWTADFTQESKSVAALKTMLGTVTGDVGVMRLPAAATVDGEMKLGQPLSTLKIDFKDLITGLAVVNDCVCAAAWSKPHLHIHNTTTNTSKQHTLRDLQAIGMVVVPNSTLVIADENKKLHFVTFNRHSLNITGHTVRDVTFEPRHISVHPVTGQLVIADRTNNAVVMCDTRGNVQERVQPRTDIYLIKCAVGTSDGYVVLDYNKDALHWMDRQGAVIWTHGSRDDKGFYSPWHMAKTSQGQLVVADTVNNRLHLIDASGRMLWHHVTKNDVIRKPSFVWLEETSSLLYLACDSGSDPNRKEIQVYKLPLPRQMYRLQVAVDNYT